MRIKSNYKTAILGLLIFAAITSAAAKEIAFYYAPGFVVGGAAYKNHATVTGIRGAADVAEYRNVVFYVSGGYSDYYYRHHLPYPSFLSAITYIPTISFEGGVKYRFAHRGVSPYVKAGPVLAVQIADLYNRTQKDVAAGVSGKLGVECSLAHNWFVDLSPAYTLLFDNPVEAGGVELVGEPHRADAHSQFVDLLIGVGYAF